MNPKCNAGSYLVYRVSLPSPIDADDQTAKDGALQQPGCVAIPKGTTELIVRLTSSDANGMHATLVSRMKWPIITLASAAFRAFRPKGWNLQEQTAGVPRLVVAVHAATGWSVQGTSRDFLFKELKGLRYISNSVSFSHSTGQEPS
ncbi:hypothetical protein QBC46DRAFT_347026 [Diplogelasinospora grovesii]|uniref:Uncharacterized protein n=1 Tax=Diplogelasinospora grovesii TaxID=303347 RepID=A0AAN6N032_9PEZI|nr:hypothetical protein QBC46DRAFT_347026 [Diplogelasinospora grovesii]